MHYKGTIVEWYTARGFGFIEPDTGHIDGADRIFCHLNAFRTRVPLPANGLEVTFEVERDERDRLCAARVIQAGATIPRPPKPAAAPAARPSRALVVSGLLLLAVIALAVLAWLKLR